MLAFANPRAAVTTSSNADLDQAIEQVDELSVKLEDANVLISGMLSAAIPKVEIKLPQLSPTLFSKDSSASDGPNFERAPLLGDEASTDQQVSLPSSAGKKKAAELRAKALAARRRAEDASTEMERQAKQALEGQSGVAKQLLAQALAAVTSVTLAVGLANAQLGTFVGPMLAGTASVFINFLGLGQTWRSRAGGIFAIVSGVFDGMEGKVVQVLDTVDDMIMNPLQDLENAIDDLCEEQKPTLQKMQKFEAGLKAIDPDFDMPDPADLKTPLDGCEAMIDEFVDKAKKEVPEKLEDMIQSNLAGRIASDAHTFNRFVVQFPLLLVFVVNLGLAILHVVVTVQPELTHYTVADKEPKAHDLQARNLRGIAFSSPSFSLSRADLMPYVQPALVQVLMSVLQLFVALALSSGPRICKMVNGQIISVQTRLNERVNDRIKQAVDRVFGQAFSEVKEKADVFFPKFKDCMRKLKRALEVAAKTGAVADAATAAVQRLGF